MLSRSLRAVLLAIALLAATSICGAQGVPQAGTYVGKFTGSVSDYEVSKGTPLKLDLTVVILADGSWTFNGVNKEGTTVLNAGASLTPYGSANLVLCKNDGGLLITIPLHFDSKGKARGTVHWVVLTGGAVFYEGKVTLTKQTQ